MDFIDLQRIDVDNAFYDWDSVKMAKRVGSIPEKFAPYFADRCECGSENIIRSSLTEITCCNPRCIIKEGYALAEMLTRFGVKGLKEATCVKIYNALKQEDAARKERGENGILMSDSYVSVLNVSFSDYPVDLRSSAKGVEFFQACVHILEGTYTFPQIISNLAIPSIGSNANRLFKGISSATVLRDEVSKAGSFNNFCAQRGSKSPMVVFNLRNSILDIITADVIFRNSMKFEGLIKLNVCMTGACTLNGLRTTKEKFIATCNEMCVDESGRSVFELKMTTAIETNPFILYSKPSGDRKFVAGTRRGRITDVFGEHEVLMKTDKFYNWLKEVMEQWNKLTEIPSKATLQKILVDSMLKIQLMDKAQGSAQNSTMISPPTSQTTASQEVATASQEASTASQEVATMNAFSS